MINHNILSEYSHSIPKTLNLTAQEEIDLANQGPEGRRTLAERNLRLVIFHAKKHAGRGIPFEDLIQEGNEGLMVAAMKFDQNRGIRFSTYASIWIRQRMGRALQKRFLIHIPIHLLDRIKPKVISSFSEWESQDKIDALKSLEEEYNRMDIDTARDLLKYVDKRTAFILTARFLEPRRFTFTEIGLILKISRERVRQIEQEGLKKIYRECKRQERIELIFAHQ